MNTIDPENPQPQQVFMNKADLENQYANLLRDDDFKKRELLKRSPNIFEITGIKHYEIRHSHFLAWLLDPNENHGLGELFLKFFLQEISLDDKSGQLSIINIADFNFKKAVIHREVNHIDLLIEIEDLVIAIENKIFSNESEFQLEKYFKSINQHYPSKQKVFVFLTVNGDDASHIGYINYSYSNIINYLNDLTLVETSISDRTRTYIEDYINNFKNNISMEGESAQLAHKIYFRHKEFFDYIIETKPSILDVIRLEIEKRVKSKGWRMLFSHKSTIKFLTPIIESKVPTVNDSGWKNEQILSLFEVYFYKKNEEVQSYFTLGPSEEAIRNVVFEKLNKLSRRKKANKTYNYYSTSTVKASTESQIDLQAETERVTEKAWNNILKLVDQVEKVL